MTIYRYEDVLPTDLDGTLIIWGKVKKGQKALQFTCPYTQEQKYVRIHEPNLAVLRERLARGTLVLVWSKSGFARVEAVLTALKLSHHKNLVVMSKPSAYLDDMSVDKWLKEQIYLEPDCGYGI